MIIIGIILLVVAIVKFLVLLPSVDQLDEDAISSNIFDINKTKRLLQLIVGFEAGLELIAALFIIFIA